MDSDDEHNKVGKAQLQPRRPGESLKVAETVLKRRDRNLKAAGERAAKIAKTRAKQKDFKKGKVRIVRAEKLVKDSRMRAIDRKRLLNKDKKPLPKPQAESNVLVVVRNGREGGSKEVKIMLRTLRLLTRHSLVFLPNTKETAAKLKTCRPFLFWGAPTFKVVTNIIHKRAQFRDPKAPSTRTPLSDNTLIEGALGDLGVLCTEDLAHELCTCTKHFEKVTERLWPVPLGDARKTTSLAPDIHFTFGDLRDKVNDKVTELIGS